jgi:hypothetical protein
VRALRHSLPLPPESRAAAFPTCPLRPFALRMALGQTDPLLTGSPEQPAAQMQRRLPETSGTVLGGIRRKAFYSVGSSIWLKPMVLTSRSIGVSGGSRLGVKKSASNW